MADYPITGSTRRVGIPSYGSPYSLKYAPQSGSTIGTLVSCTYSGGDWTAAGYGKVAETLGTELNLLAIGKFEIANIVAPLT
jgi:hypothetical protein